MLKICQIVSILIEIVLNELNYPYHGVIISFFSANRELTEVILHSK
jgi:hypothetical protein